MRSLGTTFPPALRRSARLARLRAAGRAVARQWTVLAFAACYQYGHPGRPEATVGAVLAFIWVRHLIETYRVTITLSRRVEPPAQPFCNRCPRAAGIAPSVNSPN